MSALVDTETGEVMRTSAPITDITIGERGRKDLGDIAGLAASIDKLGLIHPPTVTEDLVLVSGERRIAAYRHLGRDTIPVTVVEHLDDAAQRLRAELEENTCRKGMTASETHAQAKRIEALERPKAEERQERLGRSHGDDPSGSTDPKGLTSDKVGEGVGMSGPQWKRLKHIGDRAADGDEQAAALLAEIDAGERTITNAYKKLRGYQANGNKPATRTYESGEKRAEQIAELASKGYRAAQIATELSIGEPYVRNLAREHGIDLPDRHIQNRRHDHDRLVEQTVIAAQGAAAGLDLIDLSQVDPSRASEWADSLKSSLTPLKKLATNLKETARDQE